MVRHFCLVVCQLVAGFWGEGLYTSRPEDTRAQPSLGVDDDRIQPSRYAVISVESTAKGGYLIESTGIFLCVGGVRYPTLLR